MRRLFANSVAAMAVAITFSTAAMAQDCSTGDCGGSVVSDSFVGDSFVGDMDAGVAITSGQRRQFGQPDLFYNYYTQGHANMTNAQLYLSPLPVPANVGHTFYTYQPFYPHHMMYRHTDRYHNYYDNGRGMNRTRAMYYAPPVKTAVKNLYWNYLRIPR